MDIKTKTLTVRNVAQAVLFKHELIGQLSDGAWENSKPNDHWRPWSTAAVVVGPNLGRNFSADRVSYNFARKDLLDVVGERMIGKVRLAQAFGLTSKEAALFEEINCQGLINWDVKGARLADFDRELIDTALLHGTYTMRDLRKDLRDLGGIVKIDARWPVDPT